MSGGVKELTENLLCNPSRFSGGTTRVTSFVRPVKEDLRNTTGEIERSAHLRVDGDA